MFFNYEIQVVVESLHDDEDVFLDAFTRYGDLGRMCKELKLHNVVAMGRLSCRGLFVDVHAPCSPLSTLKSSLLLSIHTCVF